MRRIANTAYWVYSAAGAGSLALAILVLMRRLGGMNNDKPVLAGTFTTMELALIATALTLAFGLFFAMPILRQANERQVALTNRTAKLEVEAITDPLTGLYNRRYLETALREYWAEFHPAGAPLAFLTLDIDHFKKINDTYGHDAGDEVLKRFAERLKDLTREYDVVARTGGEEFCIIAPFSEESQIVPFAERIRRMVGEMKVPVADGDVSLTVSIGVASTVDKPATPQDLFKRSDRRLYEAKRNGRNRIAANSLVA